jgi:hypothetical protein
MVGAQIIQKNYFTQEVSTITNHRLFSINILTSIKPNMRDLIFEHIAGITPKASKGILTTPAQLKCDKRNVTS